MNGVRAVSFDVTHTLLHAPRLGEIYAEVLGRHGTEVDTEEVRRLARTVWTELGCSVPSGADRFSLQPGGARAFWRRYAERLCALLGAPPPTPFAAAELFDRFGRAESWEIYRDVLPCLRRLRAQGLALAVISNWDERLPLLLERSGLLPLFDCIVYSQGAHCEKPAAGIFDATLRRLALPAEAVLHIGDNVREDVEGALACGMQARLLDRSGRTGDIASLDELPELGDGLAQSQRRSEL